jgi:hypothetical protein
MRDDIKPQHFTTPSTNLKPVGAALRGRPPLQFVIQLWSVGAHCSGPPRNLNLILQEVGADGSGAPEI